MAPLISESTIQKSPMSVDSTRGARSLNCAGQFFTQRSFGGLTCESAETMRSLIGEPSCASSSPIASVQSSTECYVALAFRKSEFFHRRDAETQRGSALPEATAALRLCGENYFP